MDAATLVGLVIAYARGQQHQLGTVRFASTKPLQIEIVEQI